jgi:uncharacterized membrane protein
VNPRGPDVGAVLGGLVLVALAVAVAAHEVLDRSWDWKWYAAGVLLLTGVAVVTTAAVGALGAARAAPRAEDDPPR